MKSDDDKEEEQQEEVEATAVLGWQLAVSRIVRLLLEKRTLSDRNRVLSKATCSLERGKAAEGKMWARGVFFKKMFFFALCLGESRPLSHSSPTKEKKRISRRQSHSPLALRSISLLPSVSLFRNSKS